MLPSIFTELAYGQRFIERHAGTQPQTRPFWHVSGQRLVRKVKATCTGVLFFPGLVGGRGPCFLFERGVLRRAQGSFQVTPGPRTWRCNGGSQPLLAAGPSKGHVTFDPQSDLRPLVLAADIHCAI